MLCSPQTTTIPSWNEAVPPLMNLPLTCGKLLLLGEITYFRMLLEALLLTQKPLLCRIDRFNGSTPFYCFTAPLSLYYLILYSLKSCSVVGFDNTKVKSDWCWSPSRFWDDWFIKWLSLIEVIIRYATGAVSKFLVSLGAVDLDCNWNFWRSSFVYSW